MSSAYRLLCLSHDPALVIDIELDRDTVPADDHPALEGHQGCDLAMGRFSYPLIEVGCLPYSPGCKGCHRTTNRTDSDWLRLLAAATTAPNSVSIEVLAPVTRCWPLERLRKLRNELRF